jgi:RNA polymerase sigma-70 factor (ECF subfamily)
MSGEADFGELMGRLRQGDPRAAEQVFRRFARRLIALAGAHLDARLRGKVDPEDIQQSVLKSFFRRQAGEGFDLRDWDSLWSLLTVIALRKCGYRIRHFRAECRDVRREVQPSPGPEDAAGPGWEALAREPSPEEAAVLSETVEQLLRGLDERDRKVVEGALQGASVAHLAGELNVSERTVERVLVRTRKRLERLRELHGPEAGPGEGGAHEERR